LPLFAVKVAANFFCSGVKANVTILFDFPAFAFEAAIAS